MSPTHTSEIAQKLCVYIPECDVPVPGIPGTGNFSFFRWYQNRYRKKLVPEKVSEPVSKKFGTGKKSRNRYRKNLVPEKSGTEKSLGTGIGKI